MCLAAIIGGSEAVATDLPDTSAGTRESGSVDDPYQVPATRQAIRIDGELAAAEWRDALVLELAYETDPGENVPAPVRTELLLTYDEGQLYAAFRCHDPDPAAIRAYLCDRENFWHDDQVTLHLDTFNDQRRNFTFNVNPYGVQADCIAALGRGNDYSWDAIWDSAGKIHDWGYAVELAVPFNQLSFPRSEQALVWGLSAMRRYQRSLTRWTSLIPINRDDSCWQCQFVRIEGFAGARPGHAVELTPTATTVRTETRDELPDGDFQRANEETEFGLNLKWGVTSNLTANGTINPDFSQVEADALQLDINQPFALWYSERRPFFTEGAHFFRTLKNVVYTRTLRDPVWGAKLSGKEGASSVGAYVVRDDITNLLFPGSQGSGSTTLEQRSTAGVLRYKRDLGERSTLGAMFTGREGDEYHNRVLGFDGDLRLSARDQIQLQVLTSRTAYPEQVADEHAQPADEFGGEFIAFEYDHDARNAYWWLDLEQVDREFRGDLGFLPRVGYRNAEGGAFYTWFGEESWWTRMRLGWDFRVFEELDAIQERSPEFLAAYRTEASYARYMYRSTSSKGYLERAQAAAAQAVELSPSDPRSVVASAEVEIAAGDLEGAVLSIDALRRLDPSHPSVLLLKAELAEMRGDLDSAIEIRLQLIERRPMWSLLHGLAKAELSRGRYSDARKHLELGLDRAPGNPYLLYSLADLELEHGIPLRAVAVSESLVEQRPGHVELSMLGWAHMLSGSFPDAERAFTMAAALAPEDLSLMLALAECSELQGHSEAAADSYRVALDAAEGREDLEALVVISQCSAHIGDHVRAAEAAQMLLQRAPEEVQVLFVVSLVYSLIGELSSAIVSAQKALERGFQPMWFELPWFDSLRQDPRLVSALESSKDRVLSTTGPE